ncbi:TonB-dependent receptor, partial [Chitinophaga sp.]|uniref:TonB-dependent receptor n=1 Tax=Chitinophaga sp. TaxID=1869181 RepID=UPI0026194E75
MTRFYLMCLLMICACMFTAKAQSPAGEISGKVQDPARDYALPSATVAVYRVADSSLAGFLLTVADGSFKLGKLPPGVPLKLIITYLGYAPLIRQFTIDAQKPALPFGTLDMQRAANHLAEVVVSVPPVQMKGDTLEFNADAFRLDSASVLEDLMRKLPGVTVWGDGLITVNGKPVNNVLVDGKPFFGDKQIALQNLPKVGVEKVQVYNRAVDPISSRDSTLEMNVKLKKGYKRGMFGKLSAGAGTDSRFQGDGMISLYSP